MNTTADELYERLKEFIQDNNKRFVKSVFGETNYIILYRAEDDKITDRSYAGSNAPLSQDEILLYKNEDYSFWEPEQSAREALLNLKEAKERGHLDEWPERIEDFDSDTEITEKHKEVVEEHQVLCDKANMYICIEDWIEEQILPPGEYEDQIKRAIEYYDNMKEQKRLEQKAVERGEV